MVQTRVAPRYVVSNPAQIQYGGDNTSCIIRNLSISGAALQLSDRSATIPAVFTVIVPEDN